MSSPDQLKEVRKLVEAIKSELVNQPGVSMVPFLVVWGGRVRLSKPKATRPEILGYGLAGFWPNIPEREGGPMTSTTQARTSQHLYLDCEKSHWSAHDIDIRRAVSDCAIIGLLVIFSLTAFAYTTLEHRRIERRRIHALEGTTA